MTARELATILTTMPPDATVVLRGSDHSYDRVSEVGPAQAEAFLNRSRSGPYFLEYTGEEHKTDPKSKVVTVVVLG